MRQLIFYDNISIDFTVPFFVLFLKEKEADSKKRKSSHVDKIVHTFVYHDRNDSFDDDDNNLDETCSTDCSTDDQLGSIQTLDRNSLQFNWRLIR